MTHLHESGAILGGWLDFKTPASIPNAMKGLLADLRLRGRPNVGCDHHVVVPIEESVGQPFCFYHIREGGQREDFVVRELQKMRLRPSSLAEAVSLPQVGFPKLRATVACIDPDSMIFEYHVALVCLAVTMTADEWNFHPVMKCKPSGDVVMEKGPHNGILPLHGLIPVTDRRFDCWTP